MPREARKESSLDLYHVVVQGDGELEIFESDADKHFYFEQLNKLLGANNAQLLAWSILPGHAHLVIRAELQTLSACMKALNSEYAVYYNQVHGRVGILFRGRFRSEAIESAERLKEVVYYVHYASKKQGLTSTLSYGWSSFDAYREGSALNPQVLDAFGGAEGFKTHHSAMNAPAKCLDAAPRKRRVSDGEALALTLKVFGEVGLNGVVDMPWKERDKGIAKLKEQGLTGRQINRLTGLSLATISRA